MKKIILLFSLICVTLSAAAQASTDLYSSYFLDRMPLRHKLNAALIPEQGGYFTIPALSGFGLTVGSNIGISNLLYPTSEAGVYQTLLSPDVSSKEAIGNLSKYSGVDFSFETSILSFAFTKWEGFNTFEVNLQATGGAYIARDFFSFLKNGGNATYDLSGTSVNTTAYIEIAMGHAHKINERLTVGAKVKYLAGLASVYANFDDSYISLSGDEWVLNTVATGNIALSGLSVDGEDYEYDISNIGLAGNGVAFDFGATYRILDEISILDGVELSAAINDLGFISWSGSNTRLTGEGEKFVFSGFEEVDSDLDGQIDDLTEDLENLMTLDAESGAGTYNQMLAVNMTAGAEAIFLDDRITVGVLYTTYMRQGINASHQGTFSLNLKPCRGIQAAVIYSASNYGSNFGGVLNIAPRGFNLYLGADYGVPKMTTSFIPVDAKFGLNLNMGILFTFGERDNDN